MSFLTRLEKPNSRNDLSNDREEVRRRSQASIADSVDEVQEPWRPQVEEAETSMM
jgi:hypothetical protein